MSLEQYLFCFFVYAFLGYLCEVAYCSILQRKLVNRGYLYMPICPIYGCGAVIILLSMMPLYDMWYLVLILGILLTSSLEYLTSYVMELIFHMRWWDYSERKFNIKGRVCLRNSLMFGALVMLVVYGIQPILIGWLEAIPSLALQIIDYVLLTGMAVDTVFSTIKNINISKLVAKIQYITDEAVQELNETKEYLSNTALAVKFKELMKKYPNLSLRTIGKRLETFEEFIRKHLKGKEEKQDVDNRG